MKHNKLVFGTIITLLGGIFWGLSGTCGQFLFEQKNATANWLVPIRLLISGIIMLLVLGLQQKKEIFNIFKNKKDTLHLLFFSICGIMLCQYTYFRTIELSNAGTATVLQYISPILIMITVCFLDKKLPTFSEFLAIVFALLGIFLLATHGNVNHLVMSKETLFWGLFSAGTIVLYTLQPRKIISIYGTKVILAWAMTIGGAFLFLLFKPYAYHPVLDASSLLSLLIIIVLGTVLAFTFYMKGVSMIGATKASLYACVEPVSATVLSVLWLKVPFSFLDFMGFLSIISAIFILSYHKKIKTNISY